jgi:biopolymer transport protein ExbD
MALSFASADDDEDEVVSTINTTPLVDVMLVLLIIFLITIPVVRQTVPLRLPNETNVPRQTRPENVEVSVDAAGRLYWNGRALDGDGAAALAGGLARIAVLAPQPEVHIRGDREVRYAAVGRVVTACRRAGIAKVSFVVEPPAKG